MKKQRIMVAVSKETHKQMQEIKNHLDQRSYMWIITRAIRNYHKAVIKE